MLDGVALPHSLGVLLLDMQLVVLARIVCYQFRLINQL